MGTLVCKSSSHHWFYEIQYLTSVQQTLTLLLCQQIILNILFNRTVFYSTKRITSTIVVSAAKIFVWYDYFALVVFCHLQYLRTDWQHVSSKFTFTNYCCFSINAMCLIIRYLNWSFKTLRFTLYFCVNLLRLQISMYLGFVTISFR